MYLHMEYIFLSWSDIPELVVPIKISLIEGCWTNSSSWLSWSNLFESFTLATMTWLTVMEYLCHRWPRICSICRNHFSVHSWLITGFETRVAHDVYHLWSRNCVPFLSTWFLVRFVLLDCLFSVHYCLSLCPFSFDHCVICPSIYEFRLQLSSNSS